MSEAADKLRATVGELHAELESLDQLDPETRALLEGAVADIHRLIGEAKAGKQAARQSIVDRLTAAGRDFEESHPTLAGAVGSVIDALGRIGI